ncbi:MAG: PGPGW domain-containing protein [Actinomycetota bacterium]
MGLLHWIHEQREKLILGNAYHLLEPDEDVVQWVRIGDATSRREGFAFVTSRQVIIHWNGRRADITNFRWENVTSWAVNVQGSQGPELAVQGADFEVNIKLPTDTHATAERVADFLRRFARHAPKSERHPTNAGETTRTDWRSDGDVEVAKVPRTPLEMTRRILVTFVGVTIFVIGIIIIPLPGPWSFPVNLLGLAILASEYDWAKDGRMWTMKQYARAKAEIQRRRAARSQPDR